MYKQQIENVKTGQSACRQSRGINRIRLKYLLSLSLKNVPVDFLFLIEIGQGDFISSSVFHLSFSLMFSTSHPTYFWKQIRSRRIKVRGKQEVKQLKNSCTKSFGGFQKGIFSLKKNLNQVITNAERRARQELKKALTS